MAEAEAAAMGGGRGPVRLGVGIVVERRATGNPWQPLAWRTLAVVADGAAPGGTAAGGGLQPVATGDGWSRYAAGGLVIELFPGETAGYRENLSSRQPVVFVVLRKDEAEPGVRPLLASVCPYEAQCYLDSGEEIVDGVPMPPAVLAWVAAFVDAHPPPPPFVKRQKREHQNREQRCDGDDGFRPFRHGGRPR